jgi:hypothetical protein
MDTVVALSSWEDLRRFARQVLCEHDRLDPGQTPFFEAVLHRSGKPCGLYFEVQGPRLLRAHAIWACDEHRLLFYDSTGSRFADIQLSDAPDLADVASQSESPIAA